MLTPYATDSFSYLEQKVRDYYELRQLKTPDTKDACIWLATEVAELLDAVMRTEPGWVRNNQKETKIEDEMADSLMMLLVAADSIQVNLMNALLRKMNRKTGGELLAGKPTQVNKSFDFSDTSVF